MKRTILCVAMALMVSVAFGQKDDFKQLAQIEGVEHVSINKSMLDMVAKSGGNFDFGENLAINGMSGDILKKMENLSIYHCEAREAAENLSTQVKRILGGRGWEPLVEANEGDGEKVKIYQLQKGKNSTLVIYTEEDDESALIVIDGKLDFAKLMAEEKDSKAQKMSLSVKTHQWEDDDEDEQEPRKYRDCLIVIDGKVYPDLHTQDEAVRYMLDHNMGWSGSPKDMNVLEGKDVKKKYPYSKKKMAFEYTTSKG
jgi:hypothetical protein